MKLSESLLQVAQTLLADNNFWPEDHRLPDRHMYELWNMDYYFSSTDQQVYLCLLEAEYQKDIESYYDTMNSTDLLYM